jgi:hypothetical protein
MIPAIAAHDVEPARAVDRGPDLRPVADVECVGDGGAAAAADQGLGPGEALLVDVGAVHDGPGFCEQDGRGAADAACGSGDERGAAAEVVRREAHERTVRPYLTDRQPAGPA